MSDVVLDHIRKSFGATDVLHGVSFNIQRGQFVSLLGPSGCGKTTLLRIVAGLESVTDGVVLIDGQDVTKLPPEQRDISMMFQSYALMPHLSVYDNVRFPLRMRRIGTRSEQHERIQEALDTVQLTHLAQRKPRELSGGQQQRVALARAIVNNPKILLLDEPLSNLDARLRDEMQVELIELHQRLGLTTLFVTHDQEEALSLSDRVILLKDGRIEQDGTPEEIYRAPATRFASDFLGSANELRVRVEASRKMSLLDGTVLPVQAPESIAEGEWYASIRQEDVVLKALDQPSDGVEGVVKTRVYLGARNRFVVNVGDSRLSVLSGADSNLRNGDRVAVEFSPDSLRLIERCDG